MINSLTPSSVRPKTRINLQFIENQLFCMLVYVPLYSGMQAAVASIF